jgi:hypothetical protein
MMVEEYRTQYERYDEQELRPVPLHEQNKYQRGSSYGVIGGSTRRLIIAAVALLALVLVLLVLLGSGGKSGGDSTVRTEQIPNTPANSSVDREK